MTAVKGCHASGKTFLAAGLPLHQLDAYQHSIAVTTAPTLRQVKMFWEEISLARRNARSDLQGRIPEPSTTGLRMAEDRYALGASSSKGVNLQGFHGANVLIILDEAPGIDVGIWEAIEGIRAGGNVHVLKMGNPVIPSGEFFDAFHRARKIHNCISISAFDTPNLQDEFTGKPLTIEELLELPEDRLDFVVFPSLITRRWVKERYLAWGPSNPRYRSRVLAEFPTHSQRAVFDQEWIERAKREPTENELHRAAGCLIQVGIDVAGEGSDETAVCARVNGIKLASKAWPDKDPRGAVVNWIGDLVRAFPQYPLGDVVVDTVGVGWGFALHMADQPITRGKVWGFKAGGVAIDREQYFNIKAESYFRLREMYKENYLSHLPECLDEEREAQLSAIEYEELPNGKIQIEPKKQAKKRGVDSPDRAEAEMMAFARVLPREQTIVFGEPYSISPV